MNINKLQSLIDGKKITKAYIIKETGITRPSLDSILAGNDFKVSNLEKIALALKMPVGYFFDEEIKIDEYKATGEKGFVAQKIGKVDQREINTSYSDTENYKVRFEQLQQQLLEAQAEIIKLMKENNQLKSQI